MIDISVLFLIAPPQSADRDLSLYVVRICLFQLEMKFA